MLLQIKKENWKSDKTWRNEFVQTRACVFYAKPKQNKTELRKAFEESKAITLIKIFLYFPFSTHLFPFVFAIFFWNAMVQTKFYKL